MQTNTQRTKPVGIALMLGSCILSCFGSLFFKLGAVDLPETAGIIFILIGFAVYCAGGVFMVTAYKHGSLSVLQPINGANYVIVAILGFTILGEDITIQKIAAVILVSVGVLLVGGSESGRRES
jgi:undecaprenyl phosphate-alpha-L-ara4N flippase subunit ArnE